jgi:hypothetical protein
MINISFIYKMATLLFHSYKFIAKHGIINVTQMLSEYIPFFPRPVLPDTQIQNNRIQFVTGDPLEKIAHAAVVAFHLSKGKKILKYPIHSTIGGFSRMSIFYLLFPKYYLLYVTSYLIYSFEWQDVSIRYYILTGEYRFSY